MIVFFFFFPSKVENFPHRLTAYLQAAVLYFKSSWSSIRGNSAMFAARLVAAVPEGRRRTIDIGSVVNGNIIYIQIVCFWRLLFQRDFVKFILCCSLRKIFQFQ